MLQYFPLARSAREKCRPVLSCDNMTLIVRKGYRENGAEMSGSGCRSTRFRDAGTSH
ncbi:MAG: hypothetical protein WC780_11650 [Lentimicrobiaceae bacterium]